MLKIYILGDLYLCQYCQSSTFKRAQLNTNFSQTSNLSQFNNFCNLMVDWNSIDVFAYVNFMFSSKTWTETKKYFFDDTKLKKIDLFMTLKTVKIVHTSDFRKLVADIS